MDVILFIYLIDSKKIHSPKDSYFRVGSFVGITATLLTNHHNYLI